MECVGSSNSDLTLFADDSALTVYDKSNPLPKLNKNSIEISNWLANSRLTLNTTKSTIVKFGKASKIEDSLIIDGQRVEERPAAKYLGV